MKTAAVGRKTMDLKEQIARLNRIGIALSSEHNLSALLDLIVREVREFTHADGGSLYIKEKDKLNFLVAQNESLSRRLGHPQPFKPFYLPLTKESIAGYVAITGHLLNIEDIYNLPPDVEFRWHRDFDVQNNYRTKSMLVLPMRDHKDEIIGVLQLINSLDTTGEVVPFAKEYESLVSSLASQAAVAIRNAKLIEDIRNLFRALVRYSAKAIDARSPHTAGHSGRVAKYAMRIAEAINEETEGPLADVHLSPEELEELRMAAWLHDIGKIGVKEAVLEKSNKLSPDRMELIATRFDGIKKSLVNQYLQRKMAALKNGRLTTETTKRLEAQLQEALAQIDDDWSFLQRINTPGLMTDEDLQRLEAMARKTAIDAQGQEIPYLTPFEYENLSIRKGNLTKGEYKEIQSHVMHTLEILNKMPFTKDLENIPRYAAAHHEYLDGSGYPLGLKDGEIPLQSRILCIADIYDALTSPDRPYKKSVPLDKTLAILREEADKGKIDKDLVDLFVRRRLWERKYKEVEEEEEENGKTNATK